MHQRESKVFNEIFNRLREGKHTEDDIKIKERCTDDKNCPGEAPRLFIQNAMVDHYNETVYQTSISAELREKMMQIPHVPLKNSIKLATKLRVALNVRTDDGLTNGTSNVVKLVKLNQPNKPPGNIWAEVDDEDVGRKTRHQCSGFQLD